MQTKNQSNNLFQALFSLGFRPFFLFGSSAAVLLIFVWLLFIMGSVSKIGFFAPSIWHAHEMIFGFAVSIIAGFLLTAIQNWTGIPGLKGAKLAALVTLWLVGRIVPVISSEPSWIAASVAVSFYPALAVFLFPYYWKDRELISERVFFIFLLLLMTGDSLVYLDALGQFQGTARTGLLLGMNTIILMIVFLGGRVIPFFTEGTLIKAQPKTRKWLEAGSLISAALYLISATLKPTSLLTTVIGLCAGLFHLGRLLGWQVKRVRRVPLLWVLHLSYLWIIIGYLLSLPTALGWIPQTTALHAFGIGGVGIMIYGMISRVSLGHTGRRLHPTPATVLGYIFLIISALIRVFGTWATGSPYDWTGIVSASLWILSFLFFVFGYGRILITPRPDETSQTT